MITAKVYDNGEFIKINGQLESLELPSTFEVQGVDISNATVTPEQAMAEVASMPYLENISEYAFRQQWKDLVKQAVYKVLDSIK